MGPIAAIAAIAAAPAVNRVARVRIDVETARAREGYGLCAKKADACRPLRRGLAGGASRTAPGALRCRAMRRVHVLAAAAATVSAAALGLSAAAPGNTSHDGWPRIDGVLLMNKTDSRRPLDARPGHDPFGRRDRRYSCDAIHKRGKCHRRFIRSRGRRGRVMTFRHGHNELLGGPGSDT